MTYIHVYISLQKGPHVAKKIEIFIDLNRAGHDKSVKKNNSVLAQIFTKLWPICKFVSVAVSNNLLKNLMLKFTFKNYEIKLNYQILKVGIPLEILAGLP